MIEKQEQTIGVQAARTGIDDCAVHPMPRGSEEIKTYLPMPWRDRYGGGGRGFFGNPSTARAWTACRQTVALPARILTSCARS